MGEASAWYLYSASAAREIEAASPEASIIVMLRNPIDVMHAQHSQLLFSHQEDVEDFEEALGLESARRDGRHLPGGTFRPENLFYRRMVGFAEQLERYFEVFGRDRVHVIIHEDLRADLRGTYRDTLRFLGVDEEFAPDFQAANVNKRVRNRRMQSLIWNPPRAPADDPAPAPLSAGAQPSRTIARPQQHRGRAATRSTLPSAAASRSRWRPKWPGSATSSDATCPAGSKTPRPSSQRSQEPALRTTR